MNPTILPPAIDKIVRKADSLSLVWQPVGKKENFEFKSVKLTLKADLVQHPILSGVEGLRKFF